MTLATYHTENVLEIGIDEAGRGPLFGRVYAGAVIWPKDLTTSLVRDSKKYSKATEREKASEFIKENAIAYGVAFIEADEIDRTNIYKAVIRAMHLAVKQTKINPEHIIVDGNSFKPYCDQFGDFTNFTTIIGGDNKYYSIAAASVLAKVEHDRYIEDLCNRYPILDRYGLKKNKGYGTASHLEAIKKYGITQYHRRSFKCCQSKPIQFI
jgi:ribonuclease HII